MQEKIYICVIPLPWSKSHYNSLEFPMDHLEHEEHHEPFVAAAVPVVHAAPMVAAAPAIPYEIVSPFGSMRHSVPVKRTTTIYSNINTFYSFTIP